MLIKILIVIFMSFLGINLTGCAYKNLSSITKEDIEENKKIKIFIDESASETKAQSYIHKYVDLINTGFQTQYFYKFDNCLMKPIEEKKMQEFKEFIMLYDKNVITFCKKRMKLPDGFRIIAKQISKNKIEIETDGTIKDILAKHLALQSMVLDEKIDSKIISLGYTNFNIDTKALKEHRLVLDLYPEYMKIKDIYTDGLKQRGYVIVDNYSDADKVIFIENLAGLPMNFAGGLKNYYNKKYEEFLYSEMKNMKSMLRNVKAEDFSSYENLQSLNKIASMNITSTGISSDVGIGILATGIVLNILTSGTEKYKTYSAYKIIIENRKYDKEKSEDMERYKYRAAIYHFDMKTYSSLSTFKKKLATSKRLAANIKEDLVNYFESDYVSYANNLRRAKYENIND